jgi:aryl-alcohol dehydrogenase-like predicted oxidoreductase
MQRREFLKALPILPESLYFLERSMNNSIPSSPSGASSTTPGDMPYRTLGSTQQQVSLLGLGGFHLGVPREESESIKIIRTAIDAGVTFLDNSWDYHEGQSEVRMGNALRDGYRKRVFLMTKIDGRTKPLAAQQIDACLKRLQTETIDLMQHHEVIRLEDPDRIFAEGGANEAMIEAQKAGKIRFIGFTGHKDPMVHLRMLELADKHHFRFDAAQMPLNVCDAHFRSFEKNVVPVLVQKRMGILGMKPLGSGIILKSQTVTAPECWHYAMSLPTSTVITGIESLERLHQALQAVKSFKPLDANQLDALRQKTAHVAADGRYELFKTDNQFDATAKHPEWLG